MTRLYGQALRGRRLLAKAPFGHWKTTTFVAALRRGGLGAPMVLDGPMTGQAFLAYVEQVLIPTLEPDDIVMMDNLPAHKTAAVRAAIAAAGAQLFLLPPYSPDMNPIEIAFAKLKTLLRQARERTPTASGSASAHCSTASPQRNATTISAPPAMATHSENALGKKELPEKGRSARIGAHFLKEICAGEFIFDIALKQTEIPGGPAEIAEIPVRRGQRATARPW